MTKHKTPEELLAAKKEALYTKHIHCPVCSKAFTTKKVKMSAIRPAKRDTDFQATFVSDNPDWYEIFVCPACGYSAFEGNYQDVSPKQKLILEKTIKPKWNPRDFGGVRTLSEAIEAHMLALICYQVMGVKKSTLGKLCLRIAWLYRGEDDEKEMAFMTSSVRNFEDAYATERLDEDKANEINIMYLMGELNRRIGNYTEAARWFSVLIQDPELKKIRHMNIKVREQMSQTRDDNNRAKAAGIKTNTILDDNEEN